MTKAKALFVVYEDSGEWVLVIHAPRLTGIVMLPSNEQIRVQKICAMDKKESDDLNPVITHEQSDFQSAGTLQREIALREGDHFFVIIDLAFATGASMHISEENEFTVVAIDKPTLMKYLGYALESLHLKPAVAMLVFEHQNRHVLVGEDSEVLGIFATLEEFVRDAPLDIVDF